jgi:carbon storage regulator
MLVLERHVQETIVIGDNILITVVGIKHGAVRIGVTAPRDIPVYRSEIAARIKAEKVQS